MADDPYELDLEIEVLAAAELRKAEMLRRIEEGTAVIRLRREVDDFEDFLGALDELNRGEDDDG